MQLNDMGSLIWKEACIHIFTNSIKQNDPTCTRKLELNEIILEELCHRVRISSARCKLQ